MTATRFHAALAKLGLKQLGFARLMGQSNRSVQHWAGGTRTVPPCIELVLRLLLAGKITPADVEAARKRR
jgi:DNA-binding transcriptional regulator YiaG